MKRIFNCINKISYISGYFSGIILIIAAIIITYDVITRAFFGLNSPWALEISQYALLFATFIGGAYALRLKSYIRVDFVVDRLGRKVQKIIDIVNSILIAILFFYLSYISLKLTYTYYTKGWETSTPLKVKIYLLILIISAGTLIIFLQQLSIIFTDLFVKTDEKNTSIGM